MLHETSKQQLCKWNHAPFTIIEPIEIVDIENQHYFVHQFGKNVWSYKFWLSYNFKQEAPTINRLSGEFGQAFRSNDENYYRTRQSIARFDRVDNAQIQQYHTQTDGRTDGQSDFLGFLSKPKNTSN